LSGKLYFCPTPIGNLGDITLRVLEVLRAADLVVAEDTRHTRKLLSHFDIHKPLLSCHEHNEAERVDEILERVASGQTIAVVSDAGMPGISDPGSLLAKAAIERGLPWTVLPGPSAVLTALVLSGLSTQQFLFLGFPPRQKKERQPWLEKLKALPYTLIFYEAPHRLSAFLTDLRATLGCRQAALVREISKQFEEVERGDLGQLAAIYESKVPRGEFVVVVDGAATEIQSNVPSLEEAIAAVKRLVGEGLEPSRAIKEVAQLLGIPRRTLYNSYHQEGQ